MDSVSPIRIGAWRLDPASGELSQAGQTLHLEARTLRLLLYLAEHAGQVISIDALLEQVWPGVVVTSDSVYQAVASLRRLLGDDPKRPSYIATVPRLGYRMVAPISPWVELLAEPPAGKPLSAATERPSGARRRKLAAITLSIVLVTTALLAMILSRETHHGHAAVPPKSVAVLPFLDLTSQAMDKEYFADGMTEELIDRLSSTPELFVPSPTASFYFKGKHLPLAQVADSLGVSYVLDGSVRKSNAVLRVATRLIRARDGYIVWSETYDRPIDDELSVQEDIAREVASALRTAIR